MDNKMMISLLALSLFLRSPSSLSSAANATATAGYDLCNWLGSYYVTYDQCVSSLSPNPLSRTATYHDLAVISINLTVSNATSVQSKFRDLSIRSNSSDPSADTPLLERCVDLYGRNITALRSAAGDAAAKEYGRAGEKVFTFSSMPGDCDEEFRAKRGVASPLMKENLGVMNVALVARAINDYLSNYDQ